MYADVPSTQMGKVMSEHNAERLIEMSGVDSKSNYLAGFWQWVGILATNDYRCAFDGLYWPSDSPWTAEQMRTRITTFFGGDAPWSVVVPNDRLIGVINNSAEYQPRNKDGWGWLMAQIPLMMEPADPKCDTIPLMGLATSFFVRQFRERVVLELEIFHV